MGEVVVDALPYFDQGYDEPGVREAALALVEEETRRYRPTKNYLDNLPPLNTIAFETDVMKAEFERLQSRLPLEMLSMKRYELPQPPAGRMNDITAWVECVDNSQAQLEHQMLRIENLELLSSFGAEAWKMYNNTLVEMIEQAQKQLVDLRKKILEVNWHRKNEQMAAGAKLKALEESWVGLVSKNYEIERACVEIEQELEELEAVRRQQRENLERRRKQQEELEERRRKDDLKRREEQQKIVREKQEIEERQRKLDEDNVDAEREFERHRLEEAAKASAIDSQSSSDADHEKNEDYVSPDHNNDNSDDET